MRAQDSDLVKQRLRDAAAAVAVEMHVDGMLHGPPSHPPRLLVKTEGHAAACTRQFAGWQNSYPPLPKKNGRDVANSMEHLHGGRQDVTGASALWGG